MCLFVPNVSLFEFISAMKPRQITATSRSLDISRAT